MTADKKFEDVLAREEKAFKYLETTYANFTTYKIDPTVSTPRVHDTVARLRADVWDAIDRLILVRRELDEMNFKREPHRAMTSSRYTDVRKFGPKKADHPSVGKPCPACGKAFMPGDYTTLVALGPSDDPKEQEKARNGQTYNAVAVEVHYACVTGVEG